MLPTQVAALRQMAELYPGVRIILLGATALGLHMDMTWRGTRDLDVSLTLPVNDLSRLATLGWTPSGVEHRWVAPDGVLVDILPVDAQALREGVLRWPKSGMTMNVVGFRAAFASAIDRDLGGVVVGLPPAAAIAMLKMVAYLDQPSRREKDLGDLAYLFDLHLPEFDERRWGDEVRSHNLEYHETGPFLLGRDLAALVDEKERQFVMNFLSMLESDEAPLYPASRLVSAAPRSWGEEPDARATALQDRLRALRRGLESPALPATPEFDPAAFLLLSPEVMLMDKLTWEQIDSDGPSDFARCKVPGGWLIKMSRGGRPGGLTFLPDPNHSWEVTPKQRKQRPRSS